MALASAPLTATPITGGMRGPDGRLRENETVPALGGCPGGAAARCQPDMLNHGSVRGHLHGLPDNPLL